MPGSHLGDNYAGEWVAAAFADAGAKYERSPLAKTAIYLESLPHFNRGAVSIPDHPILLRELRGLERRVHRSGKDSVDHGAHGSDDEIEQVPEMKKPSVRRITKDGKSQFATIRTTRDCYIAFPRHPDGWGTLKDVDVVIAASIDRVKNPTEVRVHILPADEVTERLDRKVRICKAAGHAFHPTQPTWLGLYDEETDSPSSVGSGLGRKYDPIEVFPLKHAGDEAQAERAAPERASIWHDALDHLRLDQIPVGGSVTLRRVDENRIAVEIEAPPS